MTGIADNRLEARRSRHERLSARLAAMSDAELSALLAEAGPWRAHMFGSQSKTVDLDGELIFAKQVAVSEVELAAEGSTANLFGLPGCYQYGVGSAGFGAWRELEAYRKAHDWALSGACPYFPLMHHVRRGFRTPGELAERQRAWLAQAPQYWGGSEAIGRRIAASQLAETGLVLFLEYVPDTLETRLQAAGAVRDTFLDKAHEQLTSATRFMNDQGMLHFDLHAQNLLADDNQIYVADFGLALCADFDLSAEERAFFEAHRQFDRAYVAWEFTRWAEEGASPHLRARLEAEAPAAAVFTRFFDALTQVSRQTPFPAAELEAAFRSA